MKNNGIAITLIGIKYLIPCLCFPLLINPRSNDAIKAFIIMKLIKKATRNSGEIETCPILIGKEPIPSGISTLEKLACKTSTRKLIKPKTIGEIKAAMEKINMTYMVTPALIFLSTRYCSLKVLEVVSRRLAKLPPDCNPEVIN